MRPLKFILGLAVMMIPFLVALPSYADSSGLNEYWYQADYDKDGTVDFTSEKQTTATFNITINGEYTFYVSDVAGNISEMYSYEVKNIDNDIPTCTFGFVGTNTYKKLQSIDFNVADNMCLGSLVVKDSAGAVVSNTDFTTEYTQAEIEACEPHSKKKTVPFTKNGTYNWVLTDYAGNSLSGTFVINNIDTEAVSNTPITVSDLWVKRDEVSFTLTDAYGSIEKIAYDGNAYNIQTVGEAYSKQTVEAVDGDGGKERITVVSVGDTETFTKNEDEFYARPTRVSTVSVKLTAVENKTYTLRVYDTAGNENVIDITVTHIDRAKPTIESIETVKVPSRESIDVLIHAHDD